EGEALIAREEQVEASVAVVVAGRDAAHAVEAVGEAPLALVGEGRAVVDPEVRLDALGVAPADEVEVSVAVDVAPGGAERGVAPGGDGDAAGVLGVRAVAV